MADYFETTPGNANLTHVTVTHVTVTVTPVTVTVTHVTVTVTPVTVTLTPVIVIQLGAGSTTFCEYCLHYCYYY